MIPVAQEFRLTLRAGYAICNLRGVRVFGIFNNPADMIVAIYRRVFVSRCLAPQYFSTFSKTQFNRWKHGQRVIVGSGSLNRFRRN